MSTRAPRWLLALLMASFCAVTAAQEDGRALLGACLERFAEDDPSSAVSRFEEIRDLCPELKAGLEHSAPAAWLPEQWWGPGLSTSSLADLRDQIELELAERPRLELDTSGVAAALASIEEDRKAKALSWWDRVLEWLRERLQPPRGEEDASWFLNLMEKLGEHETALKITAYVLLGVIVLIALLIVANELREAGVFGKRTRFGPGHHWEEGVRERGPGLADLDRLDLNEQPALLLRLLVAAFDEARGGGERLGHAATHRELAARVALGSAEQRTAFGMLLRCAERLRYAASMPVREEVERAVAGGRRLLASLPGAGASRA